MPCYSPLQAWRAKRVNPNGKRSIVFNKNEGFADMELQLPCGKCVGCRLEYSRQWAMRCVHESKMHPSNCFVTLTYDPEHLPETGSLVKSDLQKFMKRLRKRHGANIKFYGCGEYGDKTARPHYHACLFGIDFSRDELIKTTDLGHDLFISHELSRLWKLGHSSVADFSFETAAYVARYVMKKQKGKNRKDHYERTNLETGEIISLEPEFACMSRRPGIGTTWFKQWKNDVYPSDQIIILRPDGAIPAKPPKFYDGIFEKEDPETMALLKILRKKSQEKNLNDKTLARLYVRGRCKQKQINQLTRGHE